MYSYGFNVGHRTYFISCVVISIGLKSCSNVRDADRTMCRTGGVSTQASEPHKKNLFLQSLYEEENFNMVNTIGGSNSGSPSEYQNKDITEGLEKGVQYWTDYSKVHFHPKSLYELNGGWTDVEDFDNYGIGRDSFDWASQGEEVSERLRFFVEECDHIQVAIYHLVI